MAGWIKLKGTSGDTFTVGFNKQTFDASNLTSPITWVLPDSNGSDGYFLSTDGAGNLSWAAAGASQDSTTPYYIPTGDTFTNRLYRQNLFNITITVDGTLTVDGLLVEVD